MNPDIPSLIPSDVRTILEQLDFIGNIKEGSKINVNYYLEIVPADSWLSWWMHAWKRGMQGEGRKTTIEFLQNVINNTINLLQRYQPNNLIFQHLISGLERAASGITGLKATYHYDKATLSQLNVLSMTVADQLRHYMQLVRPDTFVQLRESGPIPIPPMSRPLTIPSAPSMQDPTPPLSVSTSPITSSSSTSVDLSFLLPDGSYVKGED